MTGALDFAELAALADGAALADVACPLCGPGRRHPRNRTRPVLRIWNDDPGFASYCCARCGAAGYAFGDHGPVDPTEAQRRRAAAAARAAAEKERQREKAQYLWWSSGAAYDTSVAGYLKSRGITCRPLTLRYIPSRDGKPHAMLAPFGLACEPEPGVVTMPVHRVQAVHLTRLRPDGRGKIQEDEGEAKIMIGPGAGWPIPLAPPNDLGGLAIAEGIEDALSLHQATGLGAWAAGAAVRLPKLAPRIAELPNVEHVTIAVDADPDGRRYAAALARQLTRLRPEIDIETVEFAEVRHAA